jgi:ribosomal protein S18 acetylase RimI-like enzyme
MTDNEKLIISPGADAQTIHICALMMAQSDPWVTLGMDYAQCLPAFEGQYKEAYIAEYEHNIAGFVIIQNCGTFKGYIQTICVSEQYRGKGFGKKILRFCEETILKISPNIFICVSSFNYKAIKLYYGLGFTLAGELTNFLKPGFTELLLRKSVGPVIGYSHANNNTNC